MVGLYIGLGIGAVALVVIAVLIWRAVKAKNLKALQIAIAAEHLERIQGICGDFSAAIQRLKAQGYVCGSQIKAIQEEWKPTYQEFKQLHYYQGTESNRLVNGFKQTYGNLNNIFSKWNAEFVAAEKKSQSGLLANIDGKSLDSQQQDVVVSAEDNTLVLAGAGSGKTLTIAGKVKYLCEVKKVAPSEILLIAFTRKSAEEMTERITKRLGIPITATTFHKLGLDILKKARNESLDVLEDASKYVNQYFENELLKRPKYEGQSILLLGRTAYDSEMLDASCLFFERKSKATERFVYKKSPNTPISFLTVHRAKGLEADNVILLNFQNSTLGFPNKISDDPMLELVLSNADNYMFGEERRLFYVAMTRTKNQFFVLTDNNKPSIFFEDLKKLPHIIINMGDCDSATAVVDCPRCKTGRLVVRKNEERNKYFLGCSNYPQCEYTVNDVSIIEKPRKCRVCGGFMVERNGRFGKFYGCSNYPTCQHTEEIGSMPSKGRTRRIGF